MSFLQRQAHLKGKRSADSRPGSKKSSATSSRASSRAGSRAQSDAEDDDEFQITKFAERMNLSALSQSLDAIELSELQGQGRGLEEQQQQQQQEQQARLQLHKSSYQENFETLLRDRRSTSLEQRQDAVEKITLTLVSKYDSSLYSHGDIETLNKAVVTGRSTVEQTRAARALTIMALLDIEDTCEFLTETTLPYLEPVIVDEDQDASVRSCFVTCYAILLYYINLDNSGFGLEPKIEMLLSIATESSSENSIVSCAALLGLGLLTSVTASRNTVIEDSLPSITELLKDTDPDIRKTAGKITALMYELYDFEDQEEGTTDEDEYYGFKYGIETVDTSDLVRELSELIGESAKSIARRTKSELRSVFRKVLSTIEARLVPLDSIREDDKEDRTDHEAAAETISHLRLSKTKALPIDTWNQLNLSSILKWLYGDGLHSHVANNPLVSESISNADSKHLNRSKGRSTKIVADASFDANESKFVNKKVSQKREVSIKKGRELKAQAQSELLQGDEVY